MIGAFKAIVKRFWPALSLRVILFGTLLFVAALPGFGAVFLRVYENTLVQQTEAELVAAGALLSAAYKANWLDGAADPAVRRLGPQPPRIDLRTDPIHPPLPPAAGSGAAADVRAVRVARALAPIIADAGTVTLSTTCLLDARGTVVLGCGDRWRSHARLPEVRAGLAGRSTTTLRRRGGYAPRYMPEALSRASAIRVHHVRPVLVAGRVVGLVMLSRSPRGLFLGIYQDRGKIAIGVGLILATLLVLAGLLSRGIARPIDRLARATQDVAYGHIAVPETPATAAIEIRQLYGDFRVMAERIEQRSRYLRDFAAAVSHEFKTPIAGITGALELIGDHGATMSREERDRFIGNAAADADRLSRLVRRLLDLARADMMTVASNARTDVASAVREAAEAFRSNSLAIEVVAPSAVPPVNIPREVLKTVLETLIDNSRQATAEHVVVTLRRFETWVEIEVADDGCGIPDADHDRVFETFFTGRREAGGTGLGLSIARSLLGASRGTIASRPRAQGVSMVMKLVVAKAR